MIVVTGTKRSGTSLWMHALVAAGLPHIGDQYPAGWGALAQEANPDGFYESELIAGVYFRTNPHPLTGAYLAPQQTRDHAVKVLIPGLVRTDVAFIDRCVATVRGWRAYVASMRRLGLEDPGFPAALDWWCQQFALLRDLAIRGYPAHVVSYESFVRDPARVAAEVITWIGRGDPVKAAAAVRPVAAQERGGDEQLGGGVDPRHLAVFDELHAVIDAGRPLSPRFIEELNRTDEALRPAVLEHRARASARTVADILGRQ